MEENNGVSPQSQGKSDPAQNSGKTGQSQASGQTNKESKLDKWLRQTLQLGSQKPDTKTVHIQTPKVVEGTSVRTGGPNFKSAQPGHQAHQVRSTQPATGTQVAHPKKGGFFFGRKEKQTRPGVPAQATLQNGGAIRSMPAQEKPKHNRRAGPMPRPTNRFQRHNQKAKNFRAGAGSGVVAAHGAAHSTGQAHHQHGAHTGAPVHQYMNAQLNTWQPTAAQSASSQPQKYEGKLRIIALGGLDEVGKNCMALEYVKPRGPHIPGSGYINKGTDESEIILIDLGFQFPDEDMLGVDYIIPDITYLEDKIDRIRGIVFTHGHLDHIGAVAYLLPKLNFAPMYGTKLTMGLVEKRLEEFGLQKEAKMNTVTAEDIIQLGPFNVSFFPVNHSIPDAVGVVVKTPAGNIVHTGDFKFDHTPSGSQKPADFARIATLAYQNIAALFIDSTNALKPGHTVTEKRIGESLEHIIKNTEGRILIASFSSQIGRIQQIIDAAKKHGRQIFLSGRSLIDNVFMASKLGYLKVPDGLVHDIRKVKKLPDNKALILTTGSQGEDVSALTRMGLEEHAAVQIKKGDTVVLSSSPIPGNERAVTSVTNNLCRLGARIINNQIMDVHASGHAQQEDLKLMMSLVRPKYVVPVHGEYFMRYGNKEIAMSIGYDESHTVLIENGDVIEIENNEIINKGEKVQNNYIMVDGLGVGDIGAQVIMDRQTLAENGVLIVMVPVDEKSRKLKGNVDVISRGFIYMSESEELIKGISQIAETSYRHIIEKRADVNRAEIKKYLRESIDKFTHQKIERHPLIIPIIVEK